MNSKHRKRQMLVAAPIIIAGLVIFVFYLFYLFDDASKAEVAPRARLMGDRLETSEIWQDRVEDSTKALAEQVEILQQELQNTQKRLQSSQEKKTELTELEKHLQDLDRRLEKELSKRESSSRPSLNEGVAKTDDVKAKLIYRKESLVAQSDKKMIWDHLPAGTRLSGLLVTSVYAPTGLGSVKEPLPVKFRIMENSLLPKKLSVKLKGAYVLGTAYGDLSSRRVRVRLERLVLFKSDGSFEETKIKGWVTSEDGAEGIAANAVIDHGNEILAYAGIASFFSGAGKFLTATINNQELSKAISSDKAAYSKVGLLRSSTTEGISGGFDRIADHWLQRLEAILPTIYVVPGRECDLHILRSEKLDSRLAKTEAKG